MSMGIVYIGFHGVLSIVYNQPDTGIPELGAHLEMLSEGVILELGAQTYVLSKGVISELGELKLMSSEGVIPKLGALKKTNFE